VGAKGKKMKKIAVICALPPERNTGMATVDLAAHAVLPRLFPNTEITLYTYGKVGPWGYQRDELPFHHVDILDDPVQFLASDVFLYWGDFIHSHSYWKLDRGSWNKNETREAADQKLDECAKYMFLSGEPLERLKQAVVFGSTIITNEAEDAADQWYNDNFNRFFANIGAVFFRDALSSAKISPLRGPQATLACDCAFLLAPDDLKLLKGFVLPADRKGIGVFFGRSDDKINMLRLSRAIGERVGEECSWLPWFPTRRKLRWLARLWGYKIKPGQPGVGTLVAQLSGYKLIVTDTYHICVNAWRMGVPAICIGAGSGVATNSLGDKKKEILYEMIGARKLYIFLEALRHSKSRGQAIDQAVRAAMDPSYIAAVNANVQSYRKMAQNRLQEAVLQILQR
jgi:Polysaccharide pyruvyl transferase